MGFVMGFLWDLIGKTHWNMVGFHGVAHDDFVLFFLFYRISHPVSSNMAGWEIPMVNGGFNGKIIHKQWIFDCHV